MDRMGIQYGDRVTVVNRFGQERTGRAMIYNQKLDCWVLNMGGKYGTPLVATRDNILHIKKRRGA